MAEKTYRQIWADCLRREFTKEELIWKLIKNCEIIHDLKTKLEEQE